MKMAVPTFSMCTIKIFTGGGAGMATLMNNSCLYPPPFKLIFHHVKVIIKHIKIQNACGSCDSDFASQKVEMQRGKDAD